MASGLLVRRGEARRDEAGGWVMAASYAFGLVHIFHGCNSGQCGLSAGQRGLVEP